MAEWIKVFAWLLWAQSKRDVHCLSWILRGRLTHRGDRWIQQDESVDGVYQGMRIRISCDCGAVFMDRRFWVSQ